MLRTKGEAGTGNVVQAVRHAKTVKGDIKRLASFSDHQLQQYAEQERVAVELVQKVRDSQQLPVVNFAAGGVATPADAAMMMQLGMDGVFVGSGIFKSENPEARAKAIVQSVTNYNDPLVLAQVSENLGSAMVGFNCHEAWEGREARPGKDVAKSQPFLKSDGQVLIN